MPIPEFNEIKAPALQLLSDGQLHKLSDVYTTLANHFSLSESELNELLSNGMQAETTADLEALHPGILERAFKGDL